MGRAPCCDKANVKKGPWSPEEDAKLKSYIELHGTGGNWIALPQKIGLKRCGKSCRLRWLNYLRPNIKHGGFSEEEDNIICSLYVSIGSRWSVIAAQLPGRTDNDIKNYWNTRLKKKLLGKHRKEQEARRGKNANRGNGDSTGQQNSHLSSNQQPYWPQMPVLSPSPFSNQRPGFNDQDSIRKLLLKLGGRFSDDYQTTLDDGAMNVQFPTSTQQIYEEQVINMASSACMNAVSNNHRVQFEQSECCSEGARPELVQGQGSFTNSAVLEEMASNNYPQRLDGLEFFYGKHMDMVNYKIGSTIGITNWGETSSSIYPPLVASNYEGLRQYHTPTEYAFQELRYLGAQ